MHKVAPGSPHTYSQLRAEKAKKSINNVHAEIVKSEKIPPHEAQLNHQPEIQQIISSSADTNTCTTVHKKRKRSTDELSLVISIKRSKLSPVQTEPARKKKKKRPHSPKSYRISISRQLLNHNVKLSSSLLPLTPKVLEDNTILVNDVVDEPVKKVKKHKEKKDKLLLPVQGNDINVVIKVPLGILFMNYSNRTIRNRLSHYEWLVLNKSLPGMYLVSYNHFCQ